jgi:AAA15 family ATPase/GTPase
MSFINNIEIKNFKSIRHQKIEGCKKINVFIGYPNVGKSNILEALSLFVYLNKSQDLPLNLFIRFKELIDLFSDGDKQKDAEIFTNELVVGLRYQDKNNLEVGFVTRANYVEKFTSQTAMMLKSLRFGKDGGIHGSSIRKYEINNQVKKYQFKSEVGFIYSNQDQRVLDHPFGSNLSEVIRYNSQLRKECGELFSSYDLKLIFDENEKILVQKQLDEFSAFQFSFLQIADTLQRLIFHKAAILTNENAILLLEEPEAHMFPPYIKKLTTDILLDKTNQFFIATHSPYVLDELILEGGEDLSVYLVDYKKGQTIIHHLTNDDLSEIRQYGVDLFFNIESYLKNGQVNNT